MTRIDTRAPWGAALALALLAPAGAQDEGAADTGGDVLAHTADNPLDVLGRWVGGQWQPAGISMLSEYSRYRWGAGNRSLVVTTWQLGEDGIDPPAGTGLLYWDPEKEAILGTIVLQEGRVKEITARIAEKVWNLDYDYYSGGGVTKMTDVYEWQGEKACTYRNLIEGSEWLEVPLVREAEGSSALPVMPMDEGEPAKLGILAPLIGNWTVARKEADGTASTGRMVCYWGLDRSVAIVRMLEPVDGVETPASDGILYWSPATSSVRFLSVGSDGGVHRGSLSRAGGGLESEFVGVGTGERLFERIELPAADGGKALTAKTWLVEGDQRKLVREATYTPIE